MDISTLPPEYQRQLSMIKQENRLASFKKWVFADNCPCNAEKMAEAGFYSVATKEDPDAVQCFLCSKTLDGWEADDNPWKEHHAHSKKCTFASQQTPEEDLTMAEYFQMQEEQLIHVITKYFDDLVSKVRDASDKLQSLKENVCK